MSAPHVNPGPTPLPAGWVARFDVDKQAWFYIDTFGQPPVKSWQHPLGVLAPAPLQNNYAQPHKPPGPGIPSQQPGHSGPHNPYSQPYHPHQQPMTQTQPNFQGHPSPHHAGLLQASVPIQPPQQAHYGQTESPHAPGPYSNYGAGQGYNQVHSGHSGNNSTAQNQQQQPEPAKETGCFSGLCGNDTAKKAQNGLMKTLMKEATKFVKQHLLNQSDNKDQSETEPTSDINDKVMQLNAAYDNSASDPNDTNGYGDQYQNNRY